MKIMLWSFQFWYFTKGEHINNPDSIRKTESELLMLALPLCEKTEAKLGVLLLLLSSSDMDLSAYLSI